MSAVFTFEFDRDGIHPDGRVEIRAGRCSGCGCYTFKAEVQSGRAKRKTHRRDGIRLRCEGCNRDVRWRDRQRICLVTSEVYA